MPKPPGFLLTLLAVTLLLANYSTVAADDEPLEFRQHQRIALVGNSLAERMNLFGNFETILHRQLAEQEIVFRNFGWPADEVGIQQRPGNYTAIDDPLKVFAPDLFICFFGFNESFAGTGAAQLEGFKNNYQQWIEKKKTEFKKNGNRQPGFILVSPIAFEASGNPLQPSGEEENRRLRVYAGVIRQLAEQLGYHYVDVFEPSLQAFAAEPGLQYTINGFNLNEAGDRFLSQQLADQLLGVEQSIDFEDPQFERLRAAVNDKSWLHLQDYRMLNGWYVYGGRRTWDTETFPREYRKIRNMVSVRDQYVWDLAAGREVASEPDDSQTGEVFIPETMFGTRGEGFRRGREPETLEYPTPAESIAQMTVPEGFEVQAFASEKDFPELANPTQIAFDNRGRLWVSCMVTYPQWLPGTAKPTDRLLIFEDTNQDGKADVCKTFYDKLVCPTGFEFYNGGVLVVDEPRILFLKDTDGDDVADEVTQVLDGIGTDDTHHAMGAWEFSHGGLLHMLEGIAMSTTLETPYGPFRVAGPSGSYVWDPLTLRMRHFRTPAYGNPWCLVFDQWGNGIIGDGTGANHHWASPLSGADVNSRKTLRTIFNNEGMRPAVGNDFLTSRHFPEEIHDHFVYGCVINMHGFPRFTIRDEEDGAGLTGERIEDLLSSTDMFFRPVDPKIGPDGALWFGDWCNALIGHMQYSQRDPNRDQEHGRIYRLVYKHRDLLTPRIQFEQPLVELLDQLLAYEPRTRYRARRELTSRDADAVLAAVEKWIDGVQDPRHLCEALWVQESFRQLDPELVDRLLASDEYRARAATIHAVSNEYDRQPRALDWLTAAIEDPHPRVRVEALRGLSFLNSVKAAEIALLAKLQPTDYWIDYTFEHTLQALEPALQQAEQAGTFLAAAPDAVKQAYLDYKYSSGPGKAVYKPLRAVTNVDLPQPQRQQALDELVAARGGNADRGRDVFNRVCAACHQVGDLGKAFGPNLTDISKRMTRHELVESIVWPNEKISKGYETIAVITDDGRSLTGFVLKEDEETISLGIANGKVEEVEKVAIEVRKEMRASSMPEGLTDTIAPIEFLDLIRFLAGDWIDTARPEVGELRTREGWEEISRDAKLQIGDDYPEQWNGQAAYLLSAVAPGNRDFAFHSSESTTEPPAIKIRLAAPSQLRHIWIQNRVNPQFRSRADGLTMWVSSDGNAWTKVWTAEKPQAEYDVSLPAGPPVLMVKIGMERRATLHLNQVVLYGEQVADEKAADDK
ncbi:DUF7133 domain-containing protein [Planctomycetaceae bacterium SH139]